jgi:hypothetical protein
MSTFQVSLQCQSAGELLLITAANTRQLFACNRALLRSSGALQVAPCNIYQLSKLPLIYLTSMGIHDGPKEDHYGMNILKDTLE